MKTAHALGLAMLPALALAACSSSAKHTAVGPVGAGSPTVTHSATGVPSAGPPAVTTTAAATTGASVTTAPASPAPPGRCVSSRLGASLGQSEGTAGHTYVALLLTNRGRVTCILRGYPGVSFTAGTDVHQVGAAAQHDNRFRAAPVTLVPSATVHATVRVTDYSVYDPSACRPTRATGFRVYPPGSTGSLLIRAPQTVCSNPAIKGLQVSVVRTGASPD